MKVQENKTDINDFWASFFGGIGLGTIFLTSGFVMAFIHTSDTGFAVLAFVIFNFSRMEWLIRNK